MALNYIWLVAVVGGAALLGFALAFGMMKEDPKRAAFSIGAAFLFAAVAVGVSLYVSSFATAPIRAADREHSEEKLPAGPTHTEELPGQ
ncbi:hypothetical protein [Rhizobium sp. 2MFCol3.1]|uniref:hypothetical protein n=1 Tax=unclassified Rhizobium TaxID=2613769 RepID=UPI000362F0BD|nr:hypothetical protein [Rhizobium sp. 2MFCol3.1]